METLTTALAAITTQVDHLSEGKASQAATLSAQPRTKAWENPTAATSASFSLNMEKQAWMHVEHRARITQTPTLAITDDEMDAEEEGMPVPRKGPTTSGKLRSADTSAIHRVIWPHEYVFTPE